MAPQTAFSLPSGTPVAAGAFTSPNFSFPSNISQVTTQFAIDSPFLTDPALTLTFQLWRESSPGSGQFVFDHGFTWQGNTISPKTGQPANPSITVDVGPLAGVKCQVRVNASKAFTTAVTVTSS